MNLKLTSDKPVVFIKVQTTGVDPNKDRILELSLIKFVEGQDPVSVTRRFNPGIDIPEEATAENGIRNEDVVNEVPFEEKAESIKSFLKDCDFVGFSIRKL